MMISIIGAGIAGLATAIALKQCQCEVQVFERAARPQNIGAGIILWPNAIYVLKRLGLYQLIINASAPVSAIHRYDQYNQSLGSLNIDTLNAQAGFETRSILRSRLLKVLMARAKALNIEIHYGRQLSQISQLDTGIKLNFIAGSEQLTDAVIGADGRMNSVVRKYLLTDNQPIYQKFINIIGTASFESQQSTLSVSDYWGVGERFGVVPVSHRQAYWAAGWYSSDNSDVGHLSTSQLLTLLDKKFNHWPSAVQRILKGLDLKSLKALNIHDHNPCEYWSKGNVIMIGDAAHAALPTSGQGACQAFEDAFHIARIIDQRGLSPTTFEHFYRDRITKTTAIIHSGRALAKSLFNPDPFACHTRDIESKKTDFEHSAAAMATFWMQGL